MRKTQKLQMQKAEDLEKQVDQKVVEIIAEIQHPDTTTDRRRELKHRLRQLNLDHVQEVIELEQGEVRHDEKAVQQ